jgi:ATP-dependent DNA ligase
MAFAASHFVMATSLNCDRNRISSTRVTSPSLSPRFSAFKVKHFVLDGEIAIKIEGALSFDDLLMRIHPAESRVRKLSTETFARR